MKTVIGTLGSGSDQNGTLRQDNDLTELCISGRTQWESIWPRYYSTFFAGFPNRYGCEGLKTVIETLGAGLDQNGSLRQDMILTELCISTRTR